MNSDNNAGRKTGPTIISMLSNIKSQIIKAKAMLKNFEIIRVTNKISLPFIAFNKKYWTNVAVKKVKEPK